MTSGPPTWASPPPETRWSAPASGPRDIDFLLVQSMCPDFLNTPDGCRIHEVLGLPSRTFTTTVEASCAGFLQQLVLAQGLIATGVGTRGLIVQSAPMSRILRQADPWSAAFGDGAAAAVVGAVAEGYGILTQAHATDGSTHGGLVTGVPGARWHDEGAAYMYVANNDHARKMVMSIPDAVKDLVEISLAEAGVGPEDVAFIAAHQATILVRRGHPGGRGPAQRPPGQHVPLDDQPVRRQPPVRDGHGGA